MQATLRAIRAHLGLDIKDAAKKIGIPVNRLIAFEEHRTMPNVSTILKIMKAYNIKSIDNIIFSKKDDLIRMKQSWPRIKCSSKEVK